MEPTPPGWPRIASSLYYEGPRGAIDWICREDGAMAQSGKFSKEVRERAVLMVFEHESRYGSRWETVRSIAAQIGCSGEAFGKWARAGRDRRGPPRRRVER